MVACVHESKDNDNRKNDNDGEASEMMTYGEDGSLKYCMICKNVHENLSIHQIEMHKCPFCEGIFDLEKHNQVCKKSEQQIEIPKKYSCNICHKNFNLQKQLKDHNTNEHKKEIDLQCDHCLMVFQSKIMFARHWRTIFEEKQQEIKTLNIQLKELEAKNGEMEKALDAKKGDDVANSKPETLNSNTDVNSLKQYQCDYCKENYTKLATLFSHIRQIHKDAAAKKPFQCKKCSKNFISTLILKNHIKSKHDQKIHDKDVKFKCQQCCTPFTQAKLLEVHVKKVHK